MDHDWWWPEDSEKLSQAMKEMGWHSLKKGDEELASMNYWNDHDWFSKLRRGQGGVPSAAAALGC